MNAIQRIAQSAIWARGSIEPQHYRFRGIFRAVLPLTDVFFCWFGIVGYFLTVTSVEREAGPEWQAAWSTGLAISAFLCLIGVAFPKLWALELTAKFVLIGHVLFYVLLQLGRILDPEVSAFAGLILILVLTPIWRFVDLSAEKVRPLMRRRFIRQDRDVRDAE